MFIARLMFGGLLLALPLAGRAQTAPPRFYAGLAFYSSYYQQLGGGSYRATRIPIQLAAGLQWRPRLAVQAGLAYSSTAYSYFIASKGYSPTGGTGAYFDYNSHEATHQTSLSVLARYTLTRTPGHRIQVDVLGGLTWEHGTYHYAGTRADSVQNSLSISSFDVHDGADALLVGLGPSVRCRLGTHLELYYELLFNTNLVGTRYFQPPGITSSSALGLRYRFGRLR